MKVVCINTNMGEKAVFQNSGGALNTSVVANEQSTMHVRRVSS